jgi:uncharacterized protein
MTSRRFAKPFLALSAAIAAGLLISPVAGAGEPKVEKPIKALLVTGGGYHDYIGQNKIMSEGISARAKVEWTIVHDPSKEDNHKMPFFEDPNWAKGFDIVVHNECFGAVTDAEYVRKIVEVHKAGLPAIAVHCAMHTFRDTKSDEWREFLGVTTTNHGRRQPLDVKVKEPDHPIMKGFPTGWVAGNEELYHIKKVWPGVTVLAEALAVDGNKRENAVAWVHTYGKARVFGTTMPHNNETMADGVYLDFFTRGLLWATDKLEADGKPKAGYGPTIAAKTE